MANKVPKPSALAPGIYPVIDHATPDIRDTVVYLEVDSRLGNYKQPEYGSKYAGPRGHLRNDPWAEEGTTPEKIGRFDNHELVHVSLADERGMVRWYYARRREDQAFYNWEYSTPGQNADGYPTYTRTYFVHRNDLGDYYSEYPLNPSTPENTEPSGDKHLSLGDDDPDLSYTPQFYGFKYSDTQIGRVGDENLDALYVLVVRRFQLLCDKVTQTESETYGTVTSTVIFEDNADSSYILGAEYPLESGKYIIDLTEKFIGCSEEYRRIDISTVAIPTSPSISERVDKEFCNITTKRWVDFDASRNQNLGTVLPAIGSADPTDSTRIVVDSSLESIGQSTLAVFTVSYGVFPTEPVSSIREDQQYCRINTESYYALGDTTDLPSVGQVLEGGEVVVDATAQDISCGDVRKFSVSTAVIPTPVVTTETLNNDYCRVISETNYDLRTNIGDLPEYGDAHPTETGYQVIEAQLDDVGCGELTKRSVSYATVPTSPVTDEVDDPQFCKMYKERFYDLSTNYTLPTKGDTYKSVYVVLDSSAVSQGCGDLMQFQISYASLPTPVVVNEVLNRDFCRVITETNYDLKGNIGALPLYGDSHPTEEGYQVTDASLEDIGCGEVSKKTISYATVPTTPVIDEVDDDQFCKTYKERFYDLSTNYTLPVKGDAYKSTYTVLDAQANALGCGDLKQFTITYATLPTPVVETEILNRDYCRVITQTNYDLKSSIGALPSYGDSHPTETGYQVIEASLEDIGCGEVSKQSVSYATVPTEPVIDEMDDPQYCKMYKERFYDLSTNYTLPDKGDSYKTTHTVLDSKATAVGCGDLMRFEISYATLPTPVVVSEVLNRDYCRVISETNYDLKSNIGALPAYGDAHTTQTGYQVIEASLEDIGCGQVTKQTVSYATVPTQPVIDERDDAQFCKTYTQRFYDLGANYTLPIKGSVYETDYNVIDAKAEAAGCGDLYKFEITYASMPTPVVETEVLNKDYCRVISETNYDLKASIGSLPQYGDSHASEPGYQVIEASLEDIGCGEVTKRSISYANVPTAPRVNQIDDPEFCRVSEAFFYDLLANFDLPAKGDAYSGGYVIDAKADAVGCGDLMRFSIKYAALPTPVVTTESLHEEHCNLITETNYALKSAIGTMPSNGDANTSDSTYRVVDATIQDIGCGEVAKRTIVYAPIPSTKRKEVTESPEWGSLTQETYFDVDTATLLTHGDAYGGGYVIESQRMPQGCGVLAKYTIFYAALPTSKNQTTRQNDAFCLTTTDTWHALDTEELPSKGDAYGTGHVIDSIAEDVNLGPVRRYTVTYATLPTPTVTTKSTSDEWCDTYTDTHYDLAASLTTLAGLGSAGETGYVVVDAKIDDIGCGDIRKSTVTYAAVPSEKRTTESEHPEYCTLFSDTFYELEGYELPVQGDTYLGGYVVNAQATDINCGTVRRISIDYINLPTSKRYQHREDDTYCGVETEQFLDLDTYTTPGLGTVYGAGTVIDVSSRDIGCGGITEYSITSGVIPSPKKISIRTDDERCRIQSETFVDVDSYTLPLVDSAHPTDTDLKVVNTNQTPLGCRGISNYEITYAVIPSPPRESVREDERWGTVTDYTFYDLEGTLALPVLGDTYESQIVISAVANDVNCGSLRRYVVSTVALPTAKRYEHREDDTYCGVETEVFIASDTYVLPILGSVYGAGSVIDLSSQDLNLGGITEYRITSGVVPSPLRVTERTDNEQCRIVTEQSVQLDTFTLPAIDSSHATDTELKVVNTEENPLGCRGIKNVSITYAVIPSPPRESERDDTSYGRVIDYTYYDLEGVLPLPAIGDTYDTRIVVDAQANDVNCGTLRRYVVSTVAALPVIKDTERHDDTYCELQTETRIDTSTYTPPALGTPGGAGTIIDVSTRELHPDGLVEYTITSGVVPSPIKVAERTDNEQCVIRTETYVDLETANVPLLNDAHLTITDLKVVNVVYTPLGCRGINNIEVTYAQIPTPPRESERDDATYGRVIDWTFYDLEGVFALPTIGATYEAGIVIQAQAQDINCGDLRRYVVTTVPGLPITKETTRHDDEYCDITTDIHIDTATYLPPALGSAVGAGVVIDVSTRELNPDGLYEYTVTSGVVPTPTRTTERLDNEQCRIVTEESVQLDAYTLPAIDTAHPTDADLKVVNTQETPRGCRGIKSVSITYAVIPSPPRQSEREDDRWGRVTEYTYYDLEGTTTLATIGSTYEGGTVIAAVANDVNCGTLRRYVVSTVILPTTKRYEGREDDIYCGVEVEVFIDTNAYQLPLLGSVYGSGVVIDLTTNDLNLGGLTEYRITSGVVPSPIKVSSRTDNEQCRIVTESFVDVDTYLLPALDSAHSTDTELKVVDTTAIPLGCRGISNYQITYAVIPSPPRQSEREDDRFGRVKTYTFYDTEGTTPLPEQGSTYEEATVIEAVAEDVNCGTLRRYVISTITLPTLKTLQTRDDDLYCGVETETYFAKDAALPGLGTIYGSGVVIDTQSRDINLGGITEYTVVSGVVPSPKKLSERTDDAQCRIVTETFVDLDSYTAPSIDSAHPTDVELKVVNTTVTPLGCRGINNYEVTYAVIPSPPRQSVREDDTWGTVTSFTFYDLLGAVALPIQGSVYADNSEIVIEALAEDVNCGDLRRYVVSTVALPTSKRYLHREDDTYCGVETEVFIDLDTYELPVLGSVYGSGTIIDLQSEDINVGGVTRYTITSGVVPSPVRLSERTDNDQCIIRTESYVDVDTVPVPALDTTHSTLTDLKVVNTVTTPLGCRGIHNLEVSYAQIPSPPRDTERDDATYGRVIDYTFYDLEGVFALPSIGSTYDTGIVVNAQANDVNCGTLRRYVVTTVPALPIIKEATRQDDTYCDLQIDTLIDTAVYLPPALGSVYGSGTLIDISTREINPDGLFEYTLTSGVVPSPLRISERLDNEQCRIVTEQSVQLDSFVLPAIDDAHLTDVSLKVVNTEETPLGCRGIKNISVTYAVIPSPPRESEREDDRWGRVTEYTYYDLEGAAPLSAVGTTYEGQTVITAVAQDVNCGTLRRYVVGTILLPTPTKSRTSEDERFCLLTTESFFDLSTYVLPSRGSIHNGSPVIDSTSLDINCGGITEYTITTGQVPSPIKTSERTDDDLCRIITESFTNTDTAYTLPTLDSVHPTITGLKVVNTAATPYGCGGIFAYDVTYAQIPSPAKTNLIEDAEYGRVSIDTFYVNDQYVLLSHGAPYGGGYILSAKKDEVNCGTLIKVEYRYVTLPTSKKYVEREDREFCTLEDEVHYDLDTHVLPVAGSLHTNGSYVLEATAQDIDLGSIRKFSLTTTELPTNTQVSERKDDDMCTIHTESFYHTDTVYVQPAIGSDLSTNTLLKCISSNKDPYGCGDIYKFTNAYAQIPSPPRTSEYDDPRYCRVSVDTYYDTDGSVTLPAVGDVYGTGKVVEAKAMDVDCDGLRKYEVHYVALPLVNTSESADSTYCTTTKTETYELTSTLGSLPGQGTDNEAGQTILEVTRDAIGCGTISKQTEISTTLPSPALITISSDDNFCEIQTKVLYDKSSANFPAVGATGGLGYVIDKRVTPTGCGGVVRHEETTAAVPSPLTTVTNSDNKYCSITEYRQIVLEGSTLDYTIGDTLADSSIVVDYQQRIYKCDQFVIESYKSIDALPTEVKTASYESPDYCDANIDTFFDLSTSQQPIVGASRGTAGQVVVQVTQKPVCGNLVEFEIRYAQIGSNYKKTSEGINDLFCSVSNISYVVKTADVPGYARGDADPDDPAAVVIEYATTPLGCGILSRVNYTVGTVPSDLLSGHRINQVTGKLEAFSKKVIKNTAVDTEKKDVDLNGNYTSIQPYGCGLSLAETANIRPFETLEYDTTIQYTFPRVLTRIDLFIWPLKKGGNEIYPQFLWKKIGYSGPVKARVVEEWHLVKPVAQVPIVLMPGVLVYNSPAFRVSSPPCLHAQILFKADYGTNDKKYSYTYNSDWTVPATTYTDWPTQEFLAAWSARPAYGGYVSKSVYITAPTV